MALNAILNIQALPTERQFKDTTTSEKNWTELFVLSGFPLRKTNNQHEEANVLCAFTEETVPHANSTPRSLVSRLCSNTNSFSYKSEEKTESLASFVDALDIVYVKKVK